MRGAVRRWRGLKALAHDAVDDTTRLVFEGHESTARTVMAVLGAIEPLAGPARLVDDVRRLATQGVLGTVRAVNRAVEVVTDVGLDAAEHAARMRGERLDEELPAVPLRSDAMGSMRWLGDAALGVVNGAIGDRLHARDNGLDLGMSVRGAEGGYLSLEPGSLQPGELAGAIPEASPRVALFVHGLMATEWSWWLESEAYHGEAGASFGTLLARDLGYTPVWARYNTGRHVSENGRLLARTIARLVDAWPVPVEELLLVGHSMGGLVVRSACHYAEAEDLPWTSRVRRVFCLGSPHHGAPLERFGRVATAVLGAIDTPHTRIPARLLAARSAGIKDLCHGRLVDEDWLGQDLDAVRQAAAREIPLLEHAAYHFLSATLTTDTEHPLGHLLGDLLVLVPSASGARLTHRTFPIETRRFGGVMHHQLQNHPAVYAQLRAACEAGACEVGAL
jgi:triacylglycerol lipase